MSDTTHAPLGFREASTQLCLARSGDYPSGVTQADLRRFMSDLTPDQIERIRDKQRWEHVSALGVLRDWPSLFEPRPDQPERNQP